MLANRIHTFSKLLPYTLCFLLFFAGFSVRQIAFAQDNAISVSGPTSVIPGETYKISFRYTASAKRKIVIYLHELPNYNERGKTEATIEAGSGIYTFTIEVRGNAEPGNYRWTAKVETLDGSPIDEATQRVTVPFIGESETVTISANLSSPTENKISRRIFGLNAFKGFDPDITGNSNYKAAMEAMSPGHIRYHSWEMIRTDGHANSWLDRNGDWDPRRIAAALDNNAYGDAEILINIPWPPEVKNWLEGGRNSPLRPRNYDEFAAWCAELVRIVNVEQGRNIVYWEFTNERDGVYEGEEDKLGKIFNLCAAAAKEVDPSIKTGGPAFERPDLTSRVEGFLNATKNTLDFVSLHGYPYGNPPANQNIFDRAANFSGDLVRARNMWNRISDREIEFHFNEYNVSYQPPKPQMDNEVGMLFDALVMLSMMRDGADVANAWNEYDGWFGKVRQDFFREPASYVFELYNKKLLDGATIISSSSSNNKKVEQLVARKGNTLQVLLINRSEAVQKVLIDLEGIGDIPEQADISITEAIQAGGIENKSDSFVSLTREGYTSTPFAVTVITFDIGGASLDPETPTEPQVHKIPGRIEAENYRSQMGVEVAPTQDTGGGNQIGFIENGDYVTYKVSVQKNATYKVGIRVASANPEGGRITFKSGENELGSVEISETGGWNSFNTVELNVSLAEGDQILTLEFSGGDRGLFNINWIEFEELAAPDSPPIVGVKVKVYLHGFWKPRTGGMSSELAEKNLLPRNQPFQAAPFNYTGTEVLTDLQNEMVDWVYVEVRSDSDLNEILAKKAAMLMEDGMIHDVVTGEELTFSGLAAGIYRIAVYHKSHLPLLSANAVSFGADQVNIVDFTSDPEAAEGINQVNPVGNIFTFKSGDYDQNGLVNNLDFNFWKNQGASLNIYSPADADGNGVINNLDFNLWRAFSSAIGISELNK